MKLDDAPAPAPKPAASGSSEDRSTTFRPVEGGNEMQSGEKLLVEAYAAIWLILLAMVFFSWRRQSKTDARVAELEAALAKQSAQEGQARRAEGGE